MAMRVRMAGSVCVLVFVLVEPDLEAPAERVGDAAQGGEAWHVIASLKARDHGLGHLKPLGQLLLRLAGVRPKLKQAVGTLGGDQRAVIDRPVQRRGMLSGVFHDSILASLRSQSFAYLRS